MIKESYEGEYENLQHAGEAGMEAWKEGRRKVLLHLRQCQSENQRLREALQELVDASENGGRPYRGRDARISAKQVLKEEE